MNKLLKNKNILDNGGGVTFSGGEPLMQSEFVFSCLDILKNKLHTAIQTCGFCDEETFEIEPFALLELIGAKRGMKISGGEIDTERAAAMLLDEFRGGKIGRITLERPNELI